MNQNPYTPYITFSNIMPTKANDIRKYEHTTQYTVFV